MPSAGPLLLPRITVGLLRDMSGPESKNGRHYLAINNVRERIVDAVQGMQGGSRIIDIGGADSKYEYCY